MITDTFYTTLQAMFNGRLYPNQAPDKPTTPYAVFFVVNGAPENSLSGYSGIDGIDIQMDIYGTGYETIKALATAARAAVDASGLLAVCTVERDLYEEDTKLHRVLLEFGMHA